jgi:hypothetical protein
MSRFKLIRFLATISCLASLFSCAELSAVLGKSQSLLVEDAQSFLSQLSAFEKSKIEGIYASCLDTVAPTISGLDSPTITQCELLNQPTNQQSGAGVTPFSEDSLRWDRTFLTERALVLSYKEAEQTKQIRTYAELKALYAPIESSAEALSFVILKTPFSQVLNQATVNNLIAKIPNGADLKLLQTRIKGTQVGKTPEGNYLVKNVLVGQCASGSSVNYQISMEGEIQTLETTDLYSVTGCPLE